MSDVVDRETREELQEISHTILSVLSTMEVPVELALPALAMSIGAMVGSYDDPSTEQVRERHDALVALTIEMANFALGQRGMAPITTN